MVILGGGFAGATAARLLRRLAPTIAVTLITSGKTYLAPPGSNQVIAGLAPPARQVFTYDALAREGIAVIPAPALAVDAPLKRVRLTDGSTIPYDRLILAPGIALRPETIQGYDPETMPHGWTGDVAVLRARVAALKSGATVLISVPAAPYRCPPAPYERASLIAHALKSTGRGGKIIILDAKTGFSQESQFRQAWEALYPGMIEWIGLSDGGNLASVDAKSGTVSSDFETYTPDLACIIPPQRAAAIAAPVTDRTLWCPVEPETFRSLAEPDIHVIGDAAYAGQISKSAAAAQSEALRVAAAIAADLAGAPTPADTLASFCTSLAAPDWGFTIANAYHADGGLLVEVHDPRTTPLDAPGPLRASTAASADLWFTSATAGAFG